jgi:hypothetical protein
MTRTLKSLFVSATMLALVILGNLAPVGAQAALNATTLAATVQSGAPTLSVASANTIAVGQQLYIDREMLGVTAVSGTTITVTHGVSGTRSAGHIVGTTVYSGPVNYFSQAEPTGLCNPTAEVALPRIVGTLGNIYDCKDSVWVKYTDGGFPAFSSTSTSIYSATVAAITAKPGLVQITAGSAAALTLVSPTLAQNGMVMTIVSTTAFAHTITTPGGFNGGGAARDLCTRGGAIGDGLQIQASGGIWYVVTKTNCTLS